MKRLLIFVMLSLLILSSCSKVKVKDAPKVPESSKAPEISSSVPPVLQVEYKAADFFPLTKDVHIKYRGEGNEFAEHETYVEYVKDNIIQIRNVNPGTSLAYVYEIRDGMVKRVFSRPETYYRYDFTSLRNDNEIVIKEPIKVGTSWTSKDGRHSITAVDKDVSTPLSSYKAIEITTERQNSIDREYYVKGIGLVKRTFSTNDTSNIISSEIEKLENDVPFTHNVRFYFPDHVSDKMYYIDRNVDINTNQDMKFKFQKELKTIPEGSNLAKVLTTNVQVLGSTVDEKNNIVTVNFSSDLVTEMNAGSGPESLILKCIVNTFGTYYQVDKVIITLDGRPYSSGHIIMKPGEYFKVDTKNAVKF